MLIIIIVALLTNYKIDPFIDLSSESLQAKIVFKATFGFVIIVTDAFREQLGMSWYRLCSNYCCYC